MSTLAVPPRRSPTRLIVAVLSGVVLVLVVLSQITPPWQLTPTPLSIKERTNGYEICGTGNMYYGFDLTISNPSPSTIKGVVVYLSSQGPVFWNFGSYSDSYGDIGPGVSITRHYDFVGPRNQGCNVWVTTKSSSYADSTPKPI